MRQKILKGILLFALILLLIGGDIMFLGQGIAEAMYEDLEEQETVTNNKNVTFDCYFQEEERKVHNKKSNISNGEILTINIAVNNSRSIVFW